MCRDAGCLLQRAHFRAPATMTFFDYFSILTRVVLIGRRLGDAVSACRGSPRLLHHGHQDSPPAKSRRGPHDAGMARLAITTSGAIKHFLPHR